MMETAHEARAHALVDQIGNLEFQEALGRKGGRMGRKVRTQRKAQKSPRLTAIAKSIERYEKKLAEKRRPSKPLQPATVAAWKTRVNLLQKMRTATRRPLPMEMAAALAFENGLGKNELLAHLNAVMQMERKDKGLLIRGYIGNIRDAVREDLLQRVHDLLHKQGGVMGTKQLANALKLPVTKKNCIGISYALGVLDQMGLTHKLPNNPNGEHFWVHACHRQSPQTKPDWSLDWNLLQILRSGPRKILEIGQGSGRGKDYQKDRPPLTSYDSTSISEALAKLEQSGLVSTTALRGRGSLAQLTPYTHKLLDKQDALDYFHPDLHLALMGHPREPNQPTHVERKNMRKLIRWARTHQTLQEVRSETTKKHTPYQGVNETVRRTGEKTGYVQGVSEGYAPTRLTKDQLDRYVAFIRQRKTSIADYLDAHYPTKSG